VTGHPVPGMPATSTSDTTTGGAPTGRRVLVAGMGNEYRRDDGAGPEVARRVAELVPGATDIGPATDPLDLLGRWDNAELVVVVDAIRSGSPAGTIHLVVLDSEEERPHDRPARRATSSHGIGLAGALRLSRSLGIAPRRVVVVGVEGQDFGQGIGLTGAVADAVPVAARQVIGVIEEIGGPGR
jgi:hydrogenase maturation protease